MSPPDLLEDEHRAAKIGDRHVLPKFHKNFVCLTRNIVSDVLILWRDQMCE
jgi:hypothetical protein